MTRNAMRQADTGLEVTIGPAPCNECHSPLYFVAGKWQERHWRRISASDAIIRTYQDHVCPARVESNPLYPPKERGLQARGGYWRELLGLPRYRKAPKGRPELV